jgi:DNA-binding GntR family transcriptional regulator
VTIDPLGPTPVYQQLATILRARIESGDLAPNRPIPSETALQQEHGVARGPLDAPSPSSGMRDSWSP